MVHLCLDTSTDILSLSLFKEDNLIGEYHAPHPRQHAAFLVFKIQELFKNASYTLGDLSSISVCIGPGSFTGIRIACSTVQGLAFAKQLPIYGVSIFQAIEAYGLFQLPSTVVPRAALILFEDASQRDIFGQLLLQNLIPFEGEEGEPFYLQNNKALKLRKKLNSYIERKGSPFLVCAPTSILEALNNNSSLLKVNIDSFWDRPSYWIGQAASLLKRHTKYSEAVPFYVKPSYVDPLFKKNSSHDNF